MYIHSMPFISFIIYFAFIISQSLIYNIKEGAYSTAQFYWVTNYFSFYNNNLISSEYVIITDGTLYSYIKCILFHKLYLAISHSAKNPPLSGGA